MRAAEAEAARATFDRNALFGRYIALAAHTEAAEAEAIAAPANWSEERQQRWKK